MSDLIYLYSV